MNRLISEACKQQQIAFIGVQSIPQQRWEMLVFFDSTLLANLKITDCNDHPGNSAMGTISCDINMFNQDKLIVMTQKSVLLIAHNPTREEANEET